MSQEIPSDPESQPNTQTNGDEETEALSQLSLSGRKQRKKTSGPLFKTDLPPEVVEHCKQVLVDVHAETKKIEDETDICRATKQLKKQSERQEKYFTKGGVNDNMVIDAKAIHTNTAITCQLVKRLKTDSKQFSVCEFAEKLLLVLDPTNRGEDPNETTNGFEMTDWVEFGRENCRFQRVLPFINFIYGSFEETPEEVQPKQVKPRVKHQKTSPSTQTCATQIDPNTKTVDDSTPQEVELVLNTIKKLEAKNSSLPYIPVIVNPHSISETVENVFHSAFLVKEGAVGLQLGDDGQPNIATVDNIDVDPTDNQNGVQSVLSFSMNDWKNWINQYDINRVAIKHPKKKNKKKSLENSQEL